MSRARCSRRQPEEEAIEIGAPEHVRTVTAASSRDGEPPVEDRLADAVGRLVAAVHGGLAGGEQRTSDRCHGATSRNATLSM